MGTEGMHASLVSREVIADSIELVAFAERFDALVAIGGCDKNLPGCAMALARLNLPGVFVYGGTIMPGKYGQRDMSIQDVFEAVGAHAKGLISQRRPAGRGGLRLPWGRVMRWDVYSQHHGFGHRSAGVVACLGIARSRRWRV